MELKLLEAAFAEVRASNLAVFGKLKSLSESPCECFGSCRDQAREDELTARLTVLESKSDAHDTTIKSLIDSNRKREEEIKQLKSTNRQLHREIVRLNRQSNSTDTIEESMKLPIASGFDGHASGFIGRHSKPLVENGHDRTERLHYDNLYKFTPRYKDTLIGVKEARQVSEQNTTDVRRANSTTETKVDPDDASEERRNVAADIGESALENQDYETNGKELVLARPSVARQSSSQPQETRLIRREHLGAVSKLLPIGKYGCIHQTLRKRCLDISWDIQAGSEKSKAASAMEGHFDVESVDTVLCVDTSESMAENGSWERTCTFVYDYLSGLEEKAATPDLPLERVALVTFGFSNKVRQHLTNNIQAVREEFDNITLGGPSPMFGGLLLCNGAVTFKSLDVNGIEVCTKIILITDGNPTDSCLIEGPDACDPRFEQEVKSRILDIATKMSSIRLDVFCVPVGEEKNDFLELFVEMSDGIMVSHEDGQALSRRLYMTMEAAQEQGAQSLNLFGLNLGFYWDEVHSMYCRREESPAVMREKREILSRSNRKEDQRKQQIMEELFNDTDDPKLPKVGTRVRRGPDGNPLTMSDNNGPGTVTGHTKDRGNVLVRWDLNDSIQTCRYGHNDKYDVIIVDEPRLVSEETRMNVGCVVCPGRHFRPSEEVPHRNLTGIALGFNDERVKVKWENGANIVLSYSELKEEVVLLRDRQRQTGQRAIQAPPATMKNGKKNKNQGK